MARFESWEGELTPIYTPLLTENEILIRRWELAAEMAEMVELMLGETNLTARHRRTLERIDSSLRQSRCQL
jgi:hypothetical protein